MPLLMISGFPSSGKTHRTNQLRDYFEKRIQEQHLSHIQVQVIGDESLHIARDVYCSGAEEKNARAAILAAVERSLSKNIIVLVDHHNSIKGFRYQLYCLARAASTPSCVVHIIPSF